MTMSDSSNMTITVLSSNSRGGNDYDHSIPVATQSFYWAGINPRKTTPFPSVSI